MLENVLVSEEKKIKDLIEKIVSYDISVSIGIDSGDYSVRITPYLPCKIKKLKSKEFFAKTILEGLETSYKYLEEKINLYELEQEIKDKKYQLKMMNKNPKTE